MARPTKAGVAPASSTLLLAGRAPRRRRRRALVLVAAAVVGSLLGVGAQLRTDPPTTPPRPPTTTAPQPVDQNRLSRVSYDGDARSDVAIQTLGVPGRLLVFASDGGSLAAGDTWGTVPGTINGVRPSRLNGDFDGDGRTDAVTIATDGTSADVSVLRSDGKRFRSPTVWGTITGLGGPEDIFASGDVDGDGRSDLLVAHRSSTSGVDVEVLRSRGTSFAAPRTWASGLPWDLDFVRLMPGDFDGDGRTDLMDAGPASDGGVELRVLVSTGSGFDAPEVWRTVRDVRWEDVKLLPGDFDGDGRGDIALAIDSGQGALEVRVFRPAARSFGPGRTWFTRPGWGVHQSWLTTGDYDGDGTTDVARIADADTGGIAVSVALSDGTRLRPDRVWATEPDVGRSEMFTLGRVG